MVRQTERQGNHTPYFRVLCRQSVMQKTHRSHNKHSNECVCQSQQTNLFTAVEWNISYFNFEWILGILGFCTRIFLGNPQLHLRRIEFVNVNRFSPKCHTSGRLTKGEMIIKTKDFVLMLEWCRKTIDALLPLPNGRSFVRSKIFPLFRGLFVERTVHLRVDRKAMAIDI